ncbi:MAG: hypothetical protein AB7H77_02825, partial [Bdellovibrionales bacterium]
MTIPLPTYNPDWKVEWDEVHEELNKENAKPYEEQSHRRAEGLLKQLHAAFHAQFRTTGEYAEWMEQKARESAEGYGVAYLPIQPFAKDASVEATNRHYSELTRRFGIEAKANWGGMLSLELPTAPEPFAVELKENESRTIDVMPHSFMFPKFSESGDSITGEEKRTAPYSYVLEKRKDETNICFIQLQGEAAPSPINCIEELATELYREKFGVQAIMRGDAFVSPEKMQFFIYIPPRVNGRESFMNVGLTWDAEAGAFADVQWNHLEKVPYLLRKQAASDGLARDPDEPQPPANGRRSRSRHP